MPQIFGCQRGKEGKPNHQRWKIVPGTSMDQTQKGWTHAVSNAALQSKSTSLWKSNRAAKPCPTKLPRWATSMENACSNHSSKNETNTEFKKQNKTTTPPPPTKKNQPCKNYLPVFTVRSCLFKETFPSNMDMVHLHPSTKSPEFKNS